MKQTTVCITSLLCGVAVGSLLAMLFTPQSGPDLRHKIQDFVGDEVEKLKQKADEMQAKLRAEIEEARCRCGEKIAES